MLNDETKLLLVSRNPVYINDNGNVSIIQNVYGDDETIYSISSSNHLQEHPLMGEVTVVPDVGVIVYESEIAAVRYQSLLQTNEGKETFLQKVKEKYRKHKDIWKTKGSVESGLYSLERLDNEIDHRCKDDLMEIRYLKNDPEKGDDIRWSNVKKVRSVSSDEELGRILEMYLVFHTPTALKNRKDITNFRIVFDVYSVNKTTYVFASGVQAQVDQTTRPLYITPVNFFPVFYGKFPAIQYRQDIRDGQSEFYAMIEVESLRYAKACQLRKHDEDVKEAAIAVANFTVQNGKTLFGLGQRAFKSIKEKIANNNPSPNPGDWDF